MTAYTPTYDAVVVGAGPAGVSAAHELAQGGAGTPPTIVQKRR